MATAKINHIRKGNPTPRVQITFDPESGRTKQSHKDECDVNQIMARFQLTGAMTHFNKHQAHYEDMTGFDYTDAMQQIALANSMFEELPSSLRNRFQHDPANFLNFVQDPANKSEMAELGLLNEETTKATLTPSGEAIGETPIPVEAPPPGEATNP